MRIDETLKQFILEAQGCFGNVRPSGFFLVFLKEALYQFFMLCNKLLKTQQLKTTLILLSHSVCRSEVWAQLSRVPCQGLSKCQLEYVLIRSLDQEQIGFQALSVWARIHFLETMKFLAAYFFKTIKREDISHLASLPSGKAQVLFLRLT